MPNTSRLTISRKTAQIVTKKSTGGAKADVSPIARKVNIIKIDETGNSSPEGMYILKQEVKRLKILSAFFIVISIITAFFDLSLKRHKK